MATLAFLSAYADDEQSRTDVWDIARGGQLYDKWYGVLGHKAPQQTHPAYGDEGKKQGSSTWRCKECHGWDYRGATGAYSKGSHYSGIKGLRDMVGKDPDRIHQILMGDTHGFTDEMIPHDEMIKLAKFVSLGQIDMDLYIDRDTKAARGDAQRGASAYQTICAVCHGFDGKAINFKDAAKPEYIGTIAQANPWEFMHKARFGQPGVPMISLITLPVQDIADILAYAQTLPDK
jgi:thiosulfate dehydrogenase